MLQDFLDNLVAQDLEQAVCDALLGLYFFSHIHILSANFGDALSIV